MRKKIRLGDCSKIKVLMRRYRLNTVCEQAMCPNQGECFSRREVTFLILGRHCTRNCRFCNIDKHPPQPVDEGEPERVAEAARLLGLRHVVITSVTRDDLPDGGAYLFAKTISCLKNTFPQAKIEVLVPDFNLSYPAISMVLDACPHIFGHNVETVPSLYKYVRQGGDYLRSLKVLDFARRHSQQIYIKSSLLLGMGEKKEEVVSVMRDLLSVGCDFLSLGQYLAPSVRHYPVKEYITLQQFEAYKDMALTMGFKYVHSAPYVRTSYCASDYLEAATKDGR